MKTLIDILRICSDYYTNTGDYYIFDDDDKLVLQEYGIEADISTDDVYDSLYDIGKNFILMIFSFYLLVQKLEVIKLNCLYL